MVLELDSCCEWKVVADGVVAVAEILDVSLLLVLALVLWIKVVEVRVEVALVVFGLKKIDDTVYDNEVVFVELALDVEDKLWIWIGVVVVVEVLGTLVVAVTKEVVPPALVGVELPRDVVERLVIALLKRPLVEVTTATEVNTVLDCDVGLDVCVVVSRVDRIVERVYVWLIVE